MGSLLSFVFQSLFKRRKNFMRIDDFEALDVGRYTVKLRALGPTSLPLFLGSTIRGAFGHALKQSVCIMRPSDCPQCVMADQCIYPYLFETSAPLAILHLNGSRQAPHPFILSPPIFYPSEVGIKTNPTSTRAFLNRTNRLDESVPRRDLKRVVKPSDFRHYLSAGDDITFGLVLIGRAIDYLPYVLYTISKMAHEGLGVQRACFELSRVELVTVGMTREIYDSSSQEIVKDSPRENLGKIVNFRLGSVIYGDTLKLRFLTPTRIRVAGFPQMRPGFDLLVRNLLRRVSMLTALHGHRQLEFDARDLIASASQVMTQSYDLRWWDLERYSNRQRTKIKIGGFIGEIVFKAEELSRFLPLMAAGELLHIGGGTSFGLGRYEIVNLDS